jgi:hypothetical protein
VKSAARTVGVLGTDTLSAGIVQVAYRAVAGDRPVESLEEGPPPRPGGLGRFAPKVVILESDAQSAYHRVHRTVNRALPALARGDTGG